VRVILELAPELPAILLDKIGTQQVVLNLVRNAVEAMSVSAERRLTIRTQRRIGQDGGGYVEVLVGDTGSGLDAAIGERLFQPFVTTKATGMGVGLSICRSIVEAQGGQIRADPNPAGGTIFTFTLPTMTGEEADAADDIHRR
jgi:two-component system sensor kinase FixL